jgi:hypothetical protein
LEEALLARDEGMWKHLKARYWDVETMVPGATEAHGIRYRVPWP